MATAEQRGWGSPDAPGYRQKNIIKTRIAGVDWYVHRAYEPILRELLERYVVPTIGPITRVADDWSYVNRDIRGRPGVKSNHSWGLAVDVNATENPMGGSRHGQFPADFGTRIAHLGIKWGGDYTSRTDPMHFEFVGTPDDAAKIAARIKTRATPATPPEDDMPLTGDDIARIKKAVADDVVKRLGADATHPYTGAAIRKTVDALVAQGKATFADYSARLARIEEKVDRITPATATASVIDGDYVVNITRTE